MRVELNPELLVDRARDLCAHHMLSTEFRFQLLLEQYLELFKFQLPAFVRIETCESLPQLFDVGDTHVELLRNISNHDIILFEINVLRKEISEIWMLNRESSAIPFLKLIEGDGASTINIHCLPVS